MNDNDNNAVKLDLPPYEEEQSPFPDVDSDFSFEENKEEIYRRNIELAAENTSPAYRVMYPDNIGAEEIYPQNQMLAEKLPAENLPAENKINTKITDKKKNLLTAALCAAIVIIVAVTAFSLGRNEQALDLNAAALSNADDKAKNMHTAASACIAELIVEGVEIDGHKFENSGTVFIFGNTEKNMAEILGNSFSGYIYGVLDEETYLVEYTLWSAEPIPEEYRRRLTDSEQEALSKRGIIIGCYPSDES